MRDIQIFNQIYSLTCEDHLSSSPVIDAVFGIGDISLETALEIDHASMNMYHFSGYTALHFAIRRDDLSAVRLLLSYKAEPLSRTRDLWVDSCLHLAARLGSLALVEALLTTGSDVNARNGYDRTPLHVAVSAGNKEVVDRLLAAGASVQALDVNGCNAFHHAAWEYYGSAEDVQDFMLSENQSQLHLFTAKKHLFNT